MQPLLVFLLLLPFTLQATRCAGTSPYSACASCHPAQVRAYAQTRMASAMVPVLGSAFARDIDKLTLHEAGNGFQFIYRKNASNISVISFRGSESAVGVIDWVLGSGAQGQTPIVNSAAGYLESRVSFFPVLQRYGITVGQSAAASPNATASLGRPKTSSELSQCLGCHSVVLDAAFTKIVPGVQCGQCHPGANEHAAGKGIPLNPGKLTSSQQVGLCGNCHRVSPPVDTEQLENVRFQPLRLMQSRCFAVGKIACTTCHAAHQDAVRNAAAFYNSKCAVCHSGSSTHADARARGDCIGCHMPQVQLHAALRFTDHFIRVVHPSDYPPGTVVQRTQRLTEE